LIKESELDQAFEKTVTDLLENASLQAELSQNIKKLAKPNATKEIVEAILKLV
jgi:UDP-N-acetylglucosamine--N-acetylmuramyl-(pentapeptide) pyrophosphoryl-undecaprenol N-acetylglucosamine transferase